MSRARGPRPAAFLDRDGTIIEDVHYLARAADVRLLPGVGAAIRRLDEAGIAVVVVTNQSGIARGLLSEDDYASVHARMIALLVAEGASIDAAYHCPHHPELSGPCTCRKPGTALHERAIAEHRLDAERSTFVGDRLRDVQPARAFGGLGVLVPAPGTPAEERSALPDDFTLAATLGDAVSLAIEYARTGRAAVRADA